MNSPLVCFNTHLPQVFLKGYSQWYFFNMHLLLMFLNMSSPLAFFNMHLPLVSMGVGYSSKSKSMVEPQVGQTGPERARGDKISGAINRKDTEYPKQPGVTKSMMQSHR